MMTANRIEPHRAGSGPLLGLAEDDWNATFAVNLDAIFCAERRCRT
jgi:hypothetical protein